MRAGQSPAGASALTGAGQHADRIFAEVDAARAVYQGLLIVGHRRSVEVGEMVWAVPGRTWAYQDVLANADPRFSVASAPSAARLQQMQRNYLRLLASTPGQGPAQ